MTFRKKLDDKNIFSQRKVFRKLFSWQNIGFSNLKSRSSTKLEPQKSTIDEIGSSMVNFWGSKIRKLARKNNLWKTVFREKIFFVIQFFSKSHNYVSSVTEKYLGGPGGVLTPQESRHLQLVQKPLISVWFWHKNEKLVSPTSFSDSHVWRCTPPVLLTGNCLTSWQTWLQH